jgi:hypothetical protein
MTPAAAAEALACVYVALTEILPPYHRQIVDSVLTGALREEGLIRRADTRKVIARLVENPPRPHRRRARVR